MRTDRADAALILNDGFTLNSVLDQSPRIPKPACGSPGRDLTGRASPLERRAMHGAHRRVSGKDELTDAFRSAPPNDGRQVRMLESLPQISPN